MYPLDDKYQTLVQTDEDTDRLESLTGGLFAMRFHSLYRLYHIICAKNEAIASRSTCVPANPTPRQKMHFKRLSRNLEYARAIELNIMWELNQKLNALENV